VFQFARNVQGYNRLAAELLAAGSVRLTYLGFADMKYALDRTYNLKPTVVWVPQVTNTAATSGYVIVTNTVNSTTNNYWRMRSVP
jgi:hypothetical protein